MPPPAPRPLLAAGIALAGLATLTGCERPTPGVSVYSGSTYLNSKAVCWSEEEALTAANCSVEGVNRKALPVQAGDLIMINVDTPLEDTGWIPTINGTPLVREPLRGSSYQLALSQEDLRQNPELQVIASDRVNGPVRGVWAFPLRYEI